MRFEKNVIVAYMWNMRAEPDRQNMNFRLYFGSKGLLLLYSEPFLHMIQNVLNPLYNS